MWFVKQPSSHLLAQNQQSKSQEILEESMEYVQS